MTCAVALEEDFFGFFHLGIAVSGKIAGLDEQVGGLPLGKAVGLEHEVIGAQGNAPEVFAVLGGLQGTDVDGYDVAALPTQARDGQIAQNAAVDVGRAVDFTGDEEYRHRTRGCNPLGEAPFAENDAASVIQVGGDNEQRYLQFFYPARLDVFFQEVDEELLQDAYNDLL